VTEHYAVSRPGSLEPLSKTEAATGADWDQALADARQRSLDGPHYYTVRHVSDGRARIIATVDKGEVLWPRQPTPEVDLETRYLVHDRELEAG
jgi:hypothetical protein